jgi:uncharacterized membrane protein (DUF373 family)
MKKRFETIIAYIGVLSFIGIFYFMISSIWDIHNSDIPYFNLKALLSLLLLFVSCTMIYHPKK